MMTADLSPDTPRIEASVRISHWTVRLSRVAEFTVQVYEAVDADDAAEKATVMVQRGDVLPTGWWKESLDVDGVTEHPAGPRCQEED